MSKKNIYLFLIILLNLNAFGQDFLIQTDSTKPPEISLGEIVVNASRNQTLLKDMPSSITMITAKQVASNQIKSLEEVNVFAPNFFMVNYGTKLTSPIYIRGIGAKKNAPAVGLYVDGIPYFEIASMNFDFFEIAQLEVLRGPQGTLYGRNTMGGLININTRSPLDYQGLNMNLSAAQYGMYNATIGYYDKLKNNKFAYSLSANYRHHEGFFKNTYDHRNVDKMQSYAARNRIVYRFDNQLLVQNILSFEKSFQNGYPYKLWDKDNQKLSNVNYNDASAYDRLMLNEGLKLSYDSKNWTADAAFSYQMIDGKQTIDQDFTEKPLYFVTQKEKQNMFSAEAILRSKNIKRYSYLFGAFAFLQYLDKEVQVNIKPRALLSLKNYKQKIASIGFFHQSELKLTEHLIVTAGVRYNYEQSALTYSQAATKNNHTRSIVQDTLYPNLGEHIFLPKLSLTYHFSKQISAYLLYATGYKSGGFNSTFERPQDLKFEKQMSYNYEIGYKQSLFQGKVYADFALFLSKIDGQQIARSVPSGRGTYLKNAGHSQNRGLEFSLKIAEIRGFELNVGYGYTQAIIEKYEKNDSINYNGNIAPYVPAHTLNGMLAKTFYIKSNKYLKNIRLQLDYQQLGDIYWRLENDFKQTTYGLLNANVSLSSEQLTLTFWAKNISNTNYHTFMLSSLGKTFYQQGQPRQLGISLSAKINKQ